MKKLDYIDVRSLGSGQKDPLHILQALGGYYECPKDTTEKRLGPLVGYAGTYQPGKQWVGDVYANFAKAERWPQVLQYFASRLVRQMPFHQAGDLTVCGAPLGGLAFANLLALQGGWQYLYPEKKVETLATSSNREKTKLLFNRHQVSAPEQILIAEDVSNNFSTTAELIRLIAQSGGEVVGVACLLNRSMTTDREFTCDGKTYPIYALTRKPILEYHQDDPFVASDVQTGNIVWKPKDTADWNRLEMAMRLNP